MMWLVWRQHRYEILGLIIGAVAIVGALISGADYAARIRDELKVDNCQPLPTTNVNCATLSVIVSDRVQPFRWLVVGLFFLPALVASFIGGPLFARDLERGTHRLAWTQSITRRRWAVTKMLIVGTAAALGATLVSFVGHLASVINGVLPNAFGNFDFEGPALVASVLFGIAVAAFIGTLTRRILTGMFLGLILFGVVRLGVEYGLRPYYEPPVTAVYSASTPCPQCALGAGAWEISADFIDHSGSIVPEKRIRALTDACFARMIAGVNEIIACLAENDAYQRIRFQPADRYWRFQWTEAAIFLALAAGCALASLLLLERRDA